MIIVTILMLFQPHLGIYLHAARSERIVDWVVPAGQDGIAGDVVVEALVQVGIRGVKEEKAGWGRGWGWLAALLGG